MSQKLKYFTLKFPLAIVMLAPLVAAIIISRKADSAPPLQVAQEVPGLVTPIANQLRTFKVDCATNPDGGTTPVAPTYYLPYDTVYCENPSARPVFYGGATDVSEANGESICNGSSCLRAGFSVNVRNGLLGCDIADGGTVSIVCTAGY